MIYLHQEYLERNGFKNPLVLYNKKTTVFLKPKNNFTDCNYNNWRILSILWNETNSRTGFYEVSYCDVIHNSFLKPIYVYVWNWDEYEINLLKIISLIKKDNFYATPSNETLFSAWEVFLISSDYWLSKNTSNEFAQCVEKTINYKLSLDSRLKEYVKAKKILELHSVLPSCFFKIQSMIENQDNEWLEKIINETYKS